MKAIKCKNIHVHDKLNQNFKNNLKALIKYKIKSNIFDDVFHNVMILFLTDT